MEMADYQKYSRKTAIYPKELRGGIFYASLGLSGEVGELLNKVKKIARDNAELDKDGIKLELGDILWYVAAIAEEAGINLDDVAKANIEKLEKRRENNTIKGNGDYR
ncbi:MAG: nucleoside triphosphate pyrophosphohydrolase family protein [Candidatus Marsarchaeota archaeon]|nr:nucleoside triphosphate pyrophosphohydrolase family protein [Candidatus Marsarchaeota archaeon]MCL5101975.1 nucleoside triphosphate pyrophosphohydrolase family protein [Candidatus Marsarchaeota archaeon]